MGDDLNDFRNIVPFNILHYAQFIIYAYRSFI